VIITAAILVIVGIVGLAAIVGYGVKWLDGRQAFTLVATIIPLCLLLVGLTLITPEIRETLELLKPTPTLQPTAEPAPTETVTPHPPPGGRGE
jgi:hypothetical protein